MQRKVKMSDAVVDMSRVVPLDGGVNFRDLGGYLNQDGRRVKWRKILRCGHLANLTEKDLDALEKLALARSMISDAKRSNNSHPALLYEQNLLKIIKFLLGIFQDFGSSCLKGSLRQNRPTN